MASKLYIVSCLFTLFNNDVVTGFTSPKTAKVSTSLGMTTSSRRTFFSNVATTSAAVAAGLTLNVSPASAAGINSVNAKLQSYGLPPIVKVPDGFSALAEVWGKGTNRSPLLLTFSHPADWVVVRPSNDVNSESGTVSASEFAKGDSATFFVYEDPGKVQNIADQPKAFFDKALKKAISQKGDNLYQDFKVTNMETIDGGFKDQKYVLVDFKYTLLTGAGFEVDRNGVASVTSEGSAVEVLWVASTRQRYKKMEPKLRDIARSFRVYAEGLNFANEKVRDYSPSIY